MEDNHRLEALAFALLVKLTFVDSVIKSTTIREMQHIFRMGNARLKRVLSNALYYGYIVKEGDKYFVPTLKQRGSFNKRMMFYSGSVSKTLDNRTAYKLNALMKEIRIVVFKNHIRKQMAFQDTASVVNAPVDDKEFKRNRARLKRMSGMTSISDGLLKDSARLSISRIMEVMKTKRSTTKTIVRQLVKKGQIIRVFENIPIDMDYKELEKDYSRQQLLYREAHKRGGWLHIFKGAVYIQVANHYSLSEREFDSITYSPNLK